MCRGWRKVWGRQLAGANDGDGGVVAGGGRTAGTVLAPGSLNVPEGSGCPGMGGRRLAGGGRPGVSGKGSLGTSAPLFHIASKRAPQGPGSHHGSGRGRRTSNTRTRAGEVVLPGAPRWSFRLAGLVGGRTAGLPGWGPDCPFRRGRRPRRLPPSTPSPADGPWCGLSWTAEVPVGRRVSSLVVLSVLWERVAVRRMCSRGWVAHTW
jgi:hypothetical protein